MMELLSKIKNLADTQPESLAFISQNEEISYRELWNKSEEVASYILQLELTPSSPILIYGHMEP